MKKMTKVVSSKFRKCLGPFNIFTLKESSETVLFRECSSQLFDSQ